MYVAYRSASAGEKDKKEDKQRKKNPIRQYVIKNPTANKTSSSEKRYEICMAWRIEFSRVSATQPFQNP